jgi:pimeloyl-ACP methyl ester carboxylesterase
MMRKPEQTFVRGGFFEKSRHGLTLLRVVSRRSGVTLCKSEALPTNKHLILLHGWASSGEESRDLMRALRDVPEARNRQFWDVGYDSHGASFVQSADHIIAALTDAHADFSDVILIGNSMGGVIARQMVTLGFPCRALISVVSPHHGPAPWIPVPSRGPRSIARWSPALRKLNGHPVDIAHRGRYHFFAITYQDLLGYHAHDGIVQQHSALGCDLGPVAQRETVHLRYRTVATFDAHWRGRFVANLPPVLGTLRVLMKQN